MRRKVHTSATTTARTTLAKLLSSLIASLVLVCVAGCSGEPEGSSDPSAQALAAKRAAYDGTVGDALVEFVTTINSVADILGDIDNSNDCHEAKEALVFQVTRLRELHGVVGDMPVRAWAKMPRSFDEKRRAAIRRFNAEAVRVLTVRERSEILRDVVADIPALIYPELQD